MYWRNSIVCRKRTRVSEKLSLDAKKELEDFQAKVLSLIKQYECSPEAVCNIDKFGVNFGMPSNFPFGIQQLFLFFFRLSNLPRVERKFLSLQLRGIGKG